ncbi:GNAT family N-acetyltransferase [Ilumatobacter nonamiensis]|uniref:GNAT family N-acetyltransferase n=1 Tax=Ilumatobacter nonamiensis TaxID=467093 RepID=UPI0003479B66|nr:GNAT family N-acetyltransferase [Ilumatobacter nonamiensis]
MAPVPAQRSTVSIRAATQHDAEGMRTIYNHEVENFTTTLDMVPRSVADQQAWIAARSGVFRAIVAVTGSGSDDEPGTDERDEIVVGFASLSPYKERPAYSPTVENSIYVARSHAGLGIGRRLMDRLIADARDSGFHSMIARVEVSGEASRALHRACGFELVGIEREVGRKFGRWLDVASMQLLL